MAIDLKKTDVVIVGRTNARALVDGDELVINGAKIYPSNCSGEKRINTYTKLTRNLRLTPLESALAGKKRGKGRA